MAKTYKSVSLLDIMPANLLADANVKAAATAIDVELKKVAEHCKDVLLISRIDELPDEVIDLLAWQWHIEFYDQTLPLETKRQLVRQSIDWHRRKGTKYAVEHVLSATMIGKTIVEEWYEYNGEPGHFGVILENSEVTTKSKKYFYRVLNEVKRLSAWLDYIKYIEKHEDSLVEDEFQQVGVSMPHDEVYPYPWRFNGAWHFMGYNPEGCHNDTWQYDGAKLLDGGPMDSRPPQVETMNADQVNDGSWLLGTIPAQNTTFCHDQEDVLVNVAEKPIEEYYCCFKFFDRNQHDGTWNYGADTAVDDNMVGTVRSNKHFDNKWCFGCEPCCKHDGTWLYNGTASVISSVLFNDAFIMNGSKVFAGYDEVTMVSDADVRYGGDSYNRFNEYTYAL